MKYLHYFEVNIAHLYMTVGYGSITETEILEPGYHKVFMVTEDEARDISKRNGYKFMNGKAIKTVKTAPVQEKKSKASSPQPSKKCLNDARRIQGKAPFNSFSNYCYGDGYFAQSCLQKYGERMWNKANDIVREE